ncbi:unnamed protein product [Dovyalis caffra]|uniref:Uncharacterized protein n=1 Tax=Dovyalis caffra TaxID=77055 RepID=A0AAV1QRR1_9ROSI|nr:unnamed protein product [Dovyalis caffra]
MGGEFLGKEEPRNYGVYVSCSPVLNQTHPTPEATQGRPRHPTPPQQKNGDLLDISLTSSVSSKGKKKTMEYLKSSEETGEEKNSNKVPSWIKITLTNRKDEASEDGKKKKRKTNE